MMKTLFRACCWLVILGCWTLIGCQCGPTDGCTVDKDCAGQARCFAGVCFAPGTCKVDEHCLFGQVCRSDKCIVFRCKSNDDCKDADYCKAGTCATRRKRGEQCGDNDDICTKGHACVFVTTIESGLGICFKQCDPKDPKACGSESCIPFARKLTGETVSVCLKEVPQGSACGYEGDTQYYCQRGQYPPLYCNYQRGRKCQPAQVRSGTQEFCSTPDEPDRLDWVICEESLGLYCDQNTKKCLKTNNIVGTGEACDLGRFVLNGPALCKPGTRCFPFNQEGTLNRCVIPCDPKDGKACGDPALTCAPIYQDGTGICTLPCKTDGDCEHKGDTCRAQPDGKSICLPDFPSGNVDVGGRCNPLNQDSSCKKGLFCLKIVGSSSGFCSKTCQTDSDCPSLSLSDGKSSQSQCVSLNASGEKGCIFSCESQACPPNLSCKNFGTKRCFGP